MQKELIERAAAHGFDRVGVAKVSELRLSNAHEVRALCAKNACGSYGKNWTCPPGVGEVDACIERLRQYDDGLVVQSIGKLEDSFDWEGTVAAGKAFSDLMHGFSEVLRGEFGINELKLGAGGCKLCPKCTYPDAPCRMPDRALASVESYGIHVMLLCQKAGLPYHSGANTVTYTGLFLLPK